MKNVHNLIVFLFVISCGVQKKAIVDPYVGKYNITIFQVDGFGDIPLELVISKADQGYSAELKDPAENTPIDVLATTLTDNEFNIEAYTMGYDIYLNLTINQDEIVGTMMDMYDIEGTRNKD